MIVAPDIVLRVKVTASSNTQDTQVDCLPDTQVDMPDTQVDMPDTQVDMPDTQVEPDTQVDMPETLLTLLY